MTDQEFLTRWQRLRECHRATLDAINDKLDRANALLFQEALESGWTQEQIKAKVAKLRAELGDPWYAHSQQRSQDRLEERQDRKCAHCGETFTPKNSLGQTCSTRCRVALHRAARKTKKRKR